MKKTILSLLALGLTASTATFALADMHKGEGKMGHKGKHMERMFDRMDADSNGAVSWEEAQTAAKTRFDKIDADGNGEVTKEEAKAHHEAMRKEWKERKGMKKDGAETTTEGQGQAQPE